jgi:hypothetical protein
VNTAGFRQPEAYSCIAVRYSPAAILSDGFYEKLFMLSFYPLGISPPGPTPQVQLSF